jgi:hypothetical protein
MKKQHIKILQEIQSRIPTDLLDRLIKKEPVAPTINEVMEKALADPEVDEKLKVKLQNIKDSQYLETTRDVIDSEVEKQISDFVEAEIQKAIDTGLLPKKPNVKNYVKKTKRLSKKSGNTDGGGELAMRSDDQNVRKDERE